MWGWGLNSPWATRLGNESSPGPSPVRWGSINDAVGVYGGRDMTYVRDARGALWCSGGNGPECGLRTRPEITSPVLVPGLPELLDVAGGRNHGVALANNGTVWTWGDNDVASSAAVHFAAHTAPQQVPGLADIVDVGAGAGHSLAVTATGEVYVWGAGSRGELGLGTRNKRPSPPLVPTLGGIVEVNAGRSHSFAISGDGRLWAWGWNAGHQVGTSGAADPVARADALS